MNKAAFAVFVAIFVGMIVSVTAETWGEGEKVADLRRRIQNPDKTPEASREDMRKDPQAARRHTLVVGGLTLSLSEGRTRPEGKKAAAAD